MAFFRKADAKVRLIFEPPKLFEEKFSESFHQRPFITFSLRQHVNFIPFLSRKRMQNYCFTTYPPNVSNNFFRLFCKFLVKWLICKHVVRQVFEGEFKRTSNLYLIIIIYAHKGWVFAQAVRIFPETSAIPATGRHHPVYQPNTVANHLQQALHICNKQRESVADVAEDLQRICKRNILVFNRLSTPLQELQRF